MFSVTAVMQQKIQQMMQQMIQQVLPPEMKGSTWLLFTADIPRGVFCEWSKAEVTENPSLVLGSIELYA